MIDGAKLLGRLEELRKRVHCKLDEDHILDLMDEVEGWCSPHRSLAASATDEPTDPSWVGKMGNLDD